MERHWGNVFLQLRATLGEESAAANPPGSWENEGSSPGGDLGSVTNHLLPHQNLSSYVHTVFLLLVPVSSI